MRASITLALVLGVAASVATISCEAPSAAPTEQKAAESREGESGGGERSDSGSTPQPPPPTAPPQPGPGPDTAASPPSPPVVAFSLSGVVHGAEPGSDTTRAVRLAGATIRIYRVKAADGSSVAETLVGSATSDANGAFAFRDLSAAHYRLDISGPAGGPYADASRTIAPPLSTQVGVYILLLRKS